MSRYALFTEDENLEIFVGFDEGFGKFFLTIADVHMGTEEPESFLFHNLEHHPELGLTLGEVRFTLERFGLVLPPDLQRQLVSDACRGDGAIPRGGFEPACVSLIIRPSRALAIGTVNGISWTA